jgi:hypothetical protein
MPGMLPHRRCVPLILVLALIIAFPLEVRADESRLRVPTTVFAAAAAADWASTYHALKYYRLSESNPLIRRFDDQPAKLVAIGAAIDAGAVIAWNTGVGRKHPRLAATGLLAMAAVRTYFAIHNLRNERRVARR